jgi:hypothetical protein
MTCSGLASIDAVKASYGAVAQEASVFPGVRAFPGMVPGGVPRMSADMAAGVFSGPFAVLCGV